MYFYLYVLQRPANQNGSISRLRSCLTATICTSYAANFLHPHGSTLQSNIGIHYLAICCCKTHTKGIFPES